MYLQCSKYTFFCQILHKTIYRVSRQLLKKKGVAEATSDFCGVQCQGL